MLDGTFDEYWYDALGRRVLVRSLREDLCTSPSGCESAIERTVWADDQVLYEIRGPGGSSDDLDQTNPSGTQYGTVGYTHAGGIDQPLGVIRRNALSSGDLTTFFPHANYRGVYRAATTRTGALHTCEGQGGCINVLWPAPRRGAYHQGDATGGDWVGSLIPGMQDASGLLYRRNRYYNPQTGQFTQTDPIGLAGGLNTYGFAAGDPVTYGDPYGYCPKTLRLAPAAVLDGPAPAVDGLLALSCVVESAQIGWRLWRGARTTSRLLSESASGDAAIPAAQGLPDLTGQTQEEADATLEEAGFSQQRNTGSYRRYTHEDGSQVSIGPDGRVVRQGPLVQSGPSARSYRRRYGPDGKQIEHKPGSDTHSTGEVLRGPEP